MIWSVEHSLLSGKKDLFHMVDGAQIVSQVLHDTSIHEDYSHGNLRKWSSGGIYNCQSEETII